MSDHRAAFDFHIRFTNGRDLTGTEARNRAHRELLARRYLAVFAPSHADDIKHTFGITFEGGWIEGRLFVYDFTRATVACAASVTSHPT